MDVGEQRKYNEHSKHKQTHPGQDHVCILYWPNTDHEIYRGSPVCIYVCIIRRKS